MTILRMFTVGGSVAIAIISLLMTTDNHRMYCGFGMAFLLLVAGEAPQLFKKLATAIVDKFFTIKPEKQDGKENQKIIDRFED